MFGSTGIGAMHVQALEKELGESHLELHFKSLLEDGERRMVALLKRRGNGVFRAGEHIDHDCFEPIDAKIEVAITIYDGEAVIDFRGTSPQMKGFKNSSLANTHSAVYASFAAFFDKDLPRNEGTFRRLKIIAPAGTIVNAKSPAPLTMVHRLPGARNYARVLVGPRSASFRAENCGLGGRILSQSHPCRQEWRNVGDVSLGRRVRWRSCQCSRWFQSDWPDVQAWRLAVAECRDLRTTLSGSCSAARISM